jgi:ketosteroid isomerase-like protein
MALEIKRLHLAKLSAPGEREQTPVHGFVSTHPGGAVLVDTGVGGPDNDYAVVFHVADGLIDAVTECCDTSSMERVLFDQRPVTSDQGARQGRA